MWLFYLSLVILIFSLGASFIRGRSLRNRQFSIRSGLTRIFQILEADKRGYHYIFYGSVVLIFTLLSYQSYAQYQIWSQNEVSRFLLPPYQSISYFLFYSAIRFFAPYFISFIAASLFLKAAQKLNKKYEERFFYPEEPYMGAIAIFLTGHPGWLFYSALLIIIYLIIHIFSSLISHFSSCRISLYYLWLPTGIFVIMIQKWLELLPLWDLLKI